MLAELSRILIDGSWLFAFADDEIQLDVHGLIEDSDFKRRQTCVWDFEQLSMGAYHRIAHYPILTATVGDTDRQLRSRGTVYRALRSTGAISVGHERPTSKPIDLYRQMLEPPVLEQGERLLEPFAGTAPGLSVCQERNLRYWGVDIDAEIVEERQQEPAAVSLKGWLS
ncbi:hypothetical protein [Halomontanus rarus]|uniref:hypothetical protein n=1 Tax=Halomontanus rarus TaxID=3034020 RepID=UPI0023E84794|nr:hypothetical protein [Halovivax sp. TS33]